MPPRGKRKSGPAPSAPPSPPKRQRTAPAEPVLNKAAPPVAPPEPVDSLSPVSALSETAVTPAPSVPGAAPDPDAPLTEEERRLEDAGHPTTAGKGQGARVPVKQAVTLAEEGDPGVSSDGAVTPRRIEDTSAPHTFDPQSDSGSGRHPSGILSAVSSGVINVKAEEAEADVSQLVAGVPIDADDLGVQGPPTIKPAVLEERANFIRFMVVTNDGTPDSMIVLTGLKSIFQRQLPKMPREYIARLVFSRDHWSMAIVKRGLQVVGGITYRPFDARGFAEIVFCAITGTEQVKGYGSHLMNHLKDHVKATTRCMHFLTYADNYAIGYFKKQGFTKEIGLDRSVWAGYIKDYEGGTIMHCAMLPRIRYLDVSMMLTRQKEIILSKIRLVSRSHVVHKGLEVFRKGAHTVDPGDVPGLKESGWTPEMDELTRRPQRAPQHNIMQRLLTDLQNHPSAWPFARPINKEEVADYYDVIKVPMDLETMEVKLDANQYVGLDDFLVDARQIFQNCRVYNSETSNYVKNANKLEKHLNEKLAQYTVD